MSGIHRATRFGMSRTLTAVRTQTTRRMADAEIPECFAEATVAAHQGILDRPASARRIADSKDSRRLRDKVRRLRETDSE